MLRHAVLRSGAHLSGVNGRRVSPCCMHFIGAFAGGSCSRNCISCGRNLAHRSRHACNRRLLALAAQHHDRQMHMQIRPAFQPQARLLTAPAPPHDHPNSSRSSPACALGSPSRMPPSLSRPPRCLPLRSQRWPSPGRSFPSLRVRAGPPAGCSRGAVAVPRAALCIHLRCGEAATGLHLPCLSSHPHTCAALSRPAEVSDP